MPVVCAPLLLVHTHLLRKLMAPVLHFALDMQSNKIKNMSPKSQVVVGIPLAWPAPHQAGKIHCAIRLMRLWSASITYQQHALLIPKPDHNGAYAQ